MKKNTIIPIDRPKPFQVNELFFSTTNDKGIITSGNDIFVRVSGYQREELIGQPHNIIRHPHMPRVVFKLLWDFLLSGRSIAAYVKNMASDGSYYWVVALATPIKDGFLSVRFKPTSDVFDLVAGLYQRLLKVEQSLAPDWREGMRAAEEELGKQLKELGFSDYQSFMRFLLQTELNSRDRAVEKDGLQVVHDFAIEESRREDASYARYSEINVVSRELYGKLNSLFARLDDYMRLNSQLEKKSKFVLELTRGFRFISLNTSVRSSKLGAQGASLSVIADYMQDSSAAITRVISKLNSLIEHISAVLQTIMFNIAGAKLQIEMVISFSTDMMTKLSCDDVVLTSEESEDMRKTIERLLDAFSETAKAVQSDLCALNDQLGHLDEASGDLEKAVVSLQFIQISGVVESCGVGDERGFKVIFSEVRSQLDRSKEELKDLTLIMKRLQELARDRADIEAVFGRFQSAVSAKTICAEGVAPQ